MNKSLFVTDLDGTLLSHKDIILDENVEKLKNFRKRNGYIAVATGRPLNKIEFLKDDYGLEFDAITVLNGALIYVDNEEVSRYTMDKEATDRFIKNYIDILENGDFILEENELKLEGYLNCSDNSDLLGISIELDNMDDIYIDRVVQDMKKKYDKDFSIFRNEKFIDIGPYNTSKGKALKTIKERLNISNDNVYAIGDSYNDISMIKEAGVGSTFNEADQKIKEVAKIVVNSFAEFIEIAMGEC